MVSNCVRSIGQEPRHSQHSPVTWQHGHGVIDPEDTGVWNDSRRDEVDPTRNLILVNATRGAAKDTVLRVTQTGPVNGFVAGH